MDNLIKFSQVNDPTDWTPKGHSTVLVELCCKPCLTLDTDVECVIHECDHLKVWMANNEVIRAETKGSRS